MEKLETFHIVVHGRKEYVALLKEIAARLGLQGDHALMTRADFEALPGKTINLD